MKSVSCDAADDDQQDARHRLCGQNARPARRRADQVEGDDSQQGCLRLVRKYAADQPAPGPAERHHLEGHQKPAASEIEGQSTHQFLRKAARVSVALRLGRRALVRLGVTIGS